MTWIILGVVVGIVAIGYVYHRYTSQTTTALNDAATAVNTVINDVKTKVANTSSNTASK